MKISTVEKGHVGHVKPFGLSDHPIGRGIL